MRRYIDAREDVTGPLKNLEARTDTEAARIRRYTAMPDLSRTEGSPLHEIVNRILAIPDYKDFDDIETSEIVSTEITFDLFGFAKDHPARSRSDTYYVDDNHILRTHTTIMWYYYLRDKDVQERMKMGEAVGCFSYGKVYRKDEIDRKHMNAFHQIDSWYLAPKDKQILGKADLEHALANIAKAVIGPQVKYRFNEDSFPYTDPSIDMEVEVNGQWIELCGAGVVKGSVLDLLGVDSSKWTGWAMGPGLERFAMMSMELPDVRLLWSDDPRVKSQLKLGQKFKEVSKFPSSTRDISFVVSDDFIPNNYFDLIRDIGGDLIEQVELKDKYENEAKFGKGKVSYTYRITYRSLGHTLTNKEVDAIQKQVYNQTKELYKAELR